MLAVLLQILILPKRIIDGHTVMLLHNDFACCMGLCGCTVAQLYSGLAHSVGLCGYIARF